MGYFPGKQTATTSPRTRSPSRSGGSSRSSSPTPYKTSPALDPAVNAERMAANQARGVGDSLGRSPSDPNYGKGPTAPSSQFRTGGGASLKSATLKTRVVSPAEFQRSLAQKQQISRSTRRFLSNIEEQRRRTGAAERRRRIDAVTEKQRIVKEIRGFPLTELGRKDKQAVIDYIDAQFEPYERGKALFTPSASGKIARNLDIKLRKLGTKEVSRPITPKEYAKRPPSTLTAVKKEKGLAGVKQTVRTAQLKNRYKVETSPSQLERTFRGIVAAAGLGFASGIVGVAELIRHPLKTAKAQIEALKYPVETIRYLGNEFTVDPVGVVAEFYAFAKTLDIGGKTIKRSPAGRYVQEELFIRSQPKEVQNAIRKILKAARIQEKINPLRVKTIRAVDFLEVASLNKIEAQALARVLRNTDSVVFGSWAARTLGGKKLPKPKDVDIATADIAKFNRSFIAELPKEVRGNYVVKAQKVYRKVKSLKEASDKFGAKTIRGAIYDPIFDVKPLSRLVPQKSLLTGRGRIPVVGYVTKIKGLERIRKVLRINKRITKLKNKLSKAKTSSAKRSFKRQISKLERQRKLELKRFSPSELAQLKKMPAVGGLDFPTQKIVEVKGIKMVGFGEQTVRKALGTLQVLIERSVRRAKDPASLVRALEVQRQALKRSKSLTLFKKRKLKVLDDAIRMLKSKEFSRLLEKKVPGLTKEYPLVGKIDVKKLKNINFKKIEREALEKIKKTPKGRSKERERVKPAAKRRRRTAAKKPKRKTVSRTRKPATRPRRRVKSKKVSRPRSRSQRRSEALKTRRPSRLPKSRRYKSSRLPKTRRQKGSRLPSKLKRSRPSKLKASKPSKVRSRKGRSSRLGSSRPSKVKAAKIKPSRLASSKPSKLKPLKLRPSRIPRSRIPKGGPSRLTASRIRSALERLPRGVPKPPPNLLKRPRNKKEEERVIRWVKLQKQIYRPSLAAVLFNITGIQKGKLTGFEIRPILVRRKIARKRPKRIKRRASSRRKKKK